ncbi:MAG: MOSC domain-containing protein [Pseudomonadota bacterium]
METIASLTSRFPAPGHIVWIGLRPARKEPLIPVERATITLTGLEGDHRNKPGKRTVTLIQAEHLPVIAALSQTKDATIAPERLRRNIVVRKIPLIALRKREFLIGTARLRGTDLCAPCSRMETELGEGGYNAMRGHGGICAEVLEDGVIEIDSDVVAV